MTGQPRWTDTANADNTGTATITWGPRPGNEYVIGQITVESNSANETVCTVRVNGKLICATAAGNGDTASDPPPIVLTDRDKMTVTWTGCTVGANCEAVAFYQQSRA